MKNAAASFLLIALSISALSFAETTRDAQVLFNEANKHYSAGAFDRAVSLYESARASGVQNAALNYNLGNAYLKSGKLGKAVLHYRRALQFTPGDEDLKHNLSFAESQLKQKQPQPRHSFIARVWNSVTAALPADAWFVWAAVCFWMGCAAAIVFILRKKTFREAMPPIACIATLFIIAAAGWVSKAVGTEAHEAVVIVPKTDIRYSPSYNGAVGFELTEGLVVKALRVEDGWTQVRLAGDRSGWAEPGSVETV